MDYKIGEDELIQMISGVYRKGMHGEGCANSVAESAIRSLRSRIVDEPDVPRSAYWEVIRALTADDCETYIQEMGVPPPVVIGPGPFGPDTPRRDINGTFIRRRKHESGG